MAAAGTEGWLAVDDSGPSSAKEALRWLAEQGAPLLNASIAYRRTTPAVPMPSNPHEDEVSQKAFDSRTLLPIHRKKALLPIPAVIPEEPAVYFIWPDAEPGEHRDNLRSICERVAYLGRSRSLVRVSVEDQAPLATHVPDPAGGVQLRIPPKKGRIDYLIDKHNRDGGKPEPGPLLRYRHVDRVDRASPPSAGATSVFNRLWIFQPRQDDPPLSSQRAGHTLRQTSCRRRASLSTV